ncbi:MAG: 2-dehydropantoate 2-reductase N-terminal domain-containing protein, partial [Candidatus Omnitrophica bacterium]|nr:2-dehydropantoate 2-reductase N-terminal domain-containing protein [Candidatus Omnitrophota bacterium]
MSAQKFVVKKKAKTGGKESKQAQAVKPVIKAEEAAEVKVVIKIPPAKMNICVIGEGVLAGLIAGWLKSKMRNVFMVTSIQERKAIRSNGLKIENPKGNIYVDLDVREILDRKVDLVILAVDADNIKEIIHKSQSFLENTTILTAQNSVRAEKIISLALGDKNI